MRRRQHAVLGGTVVHLHIGRIVIDRAVTPETVPNAASLQTAIASWLGARDASVQAVSPMRWPAASQDTSSTQGTLADAVAGGVADAVAARLAIVGTQTGGRHG